MPLTGQKIRCGGCGNDIEVDDRIADGCPCNSPRGVNHGLVPSYVCTCEQCDPAQTGSVRSKPSKVARDFPASTLAEIMPTETDEAFYVG